MRALLVHPGPAFSVADVYAGWVKGLRGCGVEVAEFNLGDRLGFYGRAHVERDGEWVRPFDKEEGAALAAKGIEAACYEWWPDLVVIVSGFFVPPFIYRVMRARGHKIVLLHTESPYEDDRQILRAAYADLNIVNDPTNLDRFTEVAPTVYIPHGYDPDLHHPRPADPDLKSDFCFVGTGYPSRLEFFEQVDFGDLDVTLAGNWQQAARSPLRRYLAHHIDDCCPNTETARLYASTKASANLYRREALRPELSDGWAMGPREVELAACGVFFLRDPRGEGDEVLDMLPTFSGPGDFGDRLRWWLAHDTERDEAALKARAAVADRTFTAHAGRALRALGI